MRVLLAAVLTLGVASVFMTIGADRDRKVPRLVVLVEDRAGGPVRTPARAVEAAARRTAPPAPGISVSVSGIGYGREVPPGFVGLSLEYWAVPAYAGPDGAHVNPLLGRLLRYVAPGQAKQIRIGGHSTDRTWSPIPGMPRPPGVRYGLYPAWFSALHALAEETNARLTLGVNFEAGDPNVAAAEASSLVGNLGASSIQALELGNEPNWYTKFAWYRGADGARVLGRPLGYGLGDFIRQFSQMASVMPSSLPLAGPAVGSLGWLQHLGAFVEREPGLGDVTVHRYPLNRCLTSSHASNSATVPHLLSPASSEGLAATVAGYAATAHSYGVHFRVDELNSVACGGQLGVSDTFASALWALDTLFALEAAGVDSVAFHTFSSAAYAPFTFSFAHDRWTTAVHPEYYGMLMFARAAPAGSRLLRLRTSGDDGSVRAWADQAPDGSIRVLLINAGTRRSRQVTVTLPSSAGSVRISRLLAPSAYARRGVTIAGQSFGSRSATAILAGPQTETEVPAVGGAFPTVLPPASAALLIAR